MDDLLDDMMDITEPEGLIFIAASGILDDEDRCACWCGCEREVEWADTACDPCEEGRHPEPGGPYDDEP